MDQALHMVMVPATDMAALRKFYIDGLGWQSWGADVPGSFMLRAGTAVIVFVPRDYLAAESGIDLSATARAINAIFVETRVDVEAQFAEAVAAGRHEQRFHRHMCARQRGGEQLGVLRRHAFVVARVHEEKRRQPGTRAPLQ